MSGTAFGPELRRRRIELGLSQGEFARLVVYSPSYISKLESGRKLPTSAVALTCDGALRADGELAALAPAGSSATVAAGLDAEPWETAELVRRLELSDVGGPALEQLEATVERLCCEYPYRDAQDLLSESRQWLRYVGRLLRGNVSLREHRDLLVQAGWLALLVGCVEYDLGSRSAAESTRLSAAGLGRDAGHAQIEGWAWEMAAWFALTAGDVTSALRAARAGQHAVGGGSAAVQLAAQEGKALARLGELRELHETLDRGYKVLGQLPAAEHPGNHFIIDPNKWDFYAMDCYRVVGDNERAEHHAKRVIGLHTLPDGSLTSPMRVSEARFTLAHIALRADDLEHAVGAGRQAFVGPRRSIPHMLMSARELAGEFDERFPREPLALEFRDFLRAEQSG